MTDAKKTKNRQMWEKRVSEYKKSVLSVPKWCEENNISKSALGYWIRKLNKEIPESSFENKWLSVELSASTKKTYPPILVTIGHLTIEVIEGFNQKTFEDIVKILSKQC